MPFIDGIYSLFVIIIDTNVEFQFNVISLVIVKAESEGDFCFKGFIFATDGVNLNFNHNCIEKKLSAPLVQESRSHLINVSNMNAAE